ncbi:MAG TPA: iron-enterobactin transporter ATP-binding protein, partial [Exiguobacterium sp.]|nr:iron-enterobactin transporter ATP-binding protein [Exiguobacterium sp.]
HREVPNIPEHPNRTEGRTIVMDLHDVKQAARFADYIIAIKNGEFVKAGTCEEVSAKTVLQEVFHIDAEIGRDPRTNKPMCITYNLIKGD